ncbi:MAG: nucleotide exchange factor GrpE [Candidatus Nealsonbacteria bacterium]
MEEKLKKCEQQRDEYLAGWQRARADFLNYKKEEARKMAEFLNLANAEIILDVLPILDSFEKAEKEMSKDKKDDYIQGFLQIKNQLHNFLKKQGVQEIKSLNEKFDPRFHEAVEISEGQESGIIAEEIQKGYQLNGQVLRPAKVKVNK